MGSNNAFMPVLNNLAAALGKICTLDSLSDQNATFSTEELVLIDRIKSFNVCSVDSPNKTIMRTYLDKFPELP